MPPGTRQIEMTWRCSSCQHQNLGRFKECQECGDPKDQSETYEMPADTASAPSVGDASLLRLAVAGPNWQCPYCGSDQRRVDNTCAQCGASAEKAPPALEASDTPAPHYSLTPWDDAVDWLKQNRIAIGIVAAVLTIGIGTYLWLHRTRTFEGTVSKVTWKHTISVERYQIWTRDGWRESAPSDAFDVISNGQKVHHYDKVQDGYTTEYYTEHVACGETCTDVPQRCTEHCSDNGNGFASCTTSCTGGGRSCSTKYCDEQRSREVPRYKDVPVYQESITYKIWDWGHHRDVVASGTGISPHWPSEEEEHLGQGLAEREQERETRTSQYVVTLSYDEGSHLSFEVPAAELSSFAEGTHHPLVLDRDRPTLVDKKPRQLLEQASE